MNDLSKINILNIAWVGQGDFGDEVMAFVLRNFLASKGLDKITYYQHNIFPPFRNKKDLKIGVLHGFAENKLKKLLWDKFFLRKFNVLLVGGGSVLHSHESIRWKMDILSKMQSINNTFCANIGVSLGPFTKSMDTKTCAQYLDKCDISIFRDKYSASLAKEISPYTQALLGFDLSVLLPKLSPKYFKPSMADEKPVGLMLVKNSGKEAIFDKEKYFEKYLEILNYILKKGKKVRLFSLYVGDSYKDVELNDKLKEKCSNPKAVDIYNFNGNIFETISKMSECDQIVSMRLHGVIFSYLLNIPFLSLGYDPKNLNFIKSVNYPENMSIEFSSLKDTKKVFSSLDSLFLQGRKLYNHTLPLTSVQDIANQVLEKFFSSMIHKLYD